MTFPMAFRPGLTYSTAAKHPWNSADKGANIVLSNSDFDMTGSLSTGHSVRATTAIVDLRYWELLIVAGGLSNNLAGMMDSGASLTTYVGNTANSFGIQSTTAIAVNGITRDYATVMNFAVNDVIGMAFNRVTGKVFIHQNGTYFNGGDPGAGTGSCVSAMTSGNWYPAASGFETTSKLRMISDAASFTYPIPSGFRPYGAA